MTQDEVAKQLFLGKEIIASIEDDDYSKIVAPVYARGYSCLRSATTASC